MRKYRIRFYCGTDLRDERVVAAAGEILAIAVALSQMGMSGWVETARDRIEVTLE